MTIALKYWTDIPNAGDLFSRDVAERHIGPVSARATGEPFGSLNLMLIGSLMLWCDRDTVVCGSGMISPEIRPAELPRKIISVRGPRTRAELLKLGVSVPEHYGDAGVLAAEFATPGISQTHAYGVVLHHADKDCNRYVGRGWLRSRDDTLYIDIGQKPVAVFDQIQRCGIIFSSSLHGLIFAHALGKKAVWVKCSDRLVGGAFKFEDYFLSIGAKQAEIAPVHVAGKVDMAALARHARAYDVSHVVQQVKSSLAETRGYMQDASSRAL